MKFAVVNEERFEAQKGLKGLCPFCKSKVIAKCGTRKMHHFAHKSLAECDSWSEPETPWHRNWKNLFPKSWQEVTHYDEVSKEKHIADVKTEFGWVFEFQHSPLNPDEFKARNMFYKKIIWVIDGLRNKTEKSKFQKIWDSAQSVSKNQSFKRVLKDQFKPFDKWLQNMAPVYLDFGIEDKLWCIIPYVDSEWVYIGCFKKSDLINVHALQGEIGSRNYLQYMRKVVSDIVELERGPVQQVVRVPMRHRGGWRSPRL